MVRRRWMAGTAALVLVACSACGSAARTGAAPTTPAPTTTVPATAPASTTRTVAARRVDVAAVEMLASGAGWALERPLTCGPTFCGPGVERTIDGGVTWSGANQGVDLGTGAGQVDDVAFADPTHGYLWGPGLEISTDAGATWRQVRILAGLAPFAVAALVATPATVVAVVRAAGLGGTPNRPGTATGPYLVVTAAPGSASFHAVGQLPGGTGQAVQLVATASGVLAAQGRSLDAVGPAGPAPVGTLPASGCALAASGGAGLLAVCGAGGARTAWTSTDGGGHWTGRSAPGPGAGTTTDGVAASGASAAVATTGTAGSALLVTSDGGRTWTTALSVPGLTLGTPRYATSRLATVVARPLAGGAGVLYRSTDGGRTWSAVAL